MQRVSRRILLLTVSTDSFLLEYGLSLQPLFTDTETLSLLDSSAADSLTHPIHNPYKVSFQNRI